jgi:hypothetical protein
MAFGDKNKKNPFVKKDADETKNDAPDKKGGSSDQPTEGKSDNKSDDKEKKSPPQPGKSGSNKGEGMEIKDKVKVDLEPTYKLKEDIEFIFDNDLSDISEHADIVEWYEREAQELGEDISFTTRLKRKALMRRFKQRLKISRERSVNRRATIDRIANRARKSAISTLKAKFSGGKKTSDLSNSEKNRVERMVHQRKNSVIRLTRKLIRKKRELERDRLK